MSVGVCEDLYNSHASVHHERILRVILMFWAVELTSVSVMSPMVSAGISFCHQPGPSPNVGTVVHPHAWPRPSLAPHSYHAPLL